MTIGNGNDLEETIYQAGLHSLPVINSNHNGTGSGCLWIVSNPRATALPHQVSHQQREVTREQAFLPLSEEQEGKMQRGARYYVSHFRCIFLLNLAESLGGRY